MKLTTKRNWAYFFRELFLYLIPMILIVGSVDTFFSYVQCLPHIERSMPCNGILKIKWWFYAIILFVVIVLCIISAKRLKKLKKQIENNFIESANKCQINSNDLEVEDAATKKVVKKKSIAKATNPKKSSSSKTSKKTSEKFSTQKKSNK